MAPEIAPLYIAYLAPGYLSQAPSGLRPGAAYLGGLEGNNLRNLKGIPITTKELSDFLAGKIAEIDKVPIAEQPIPKMEAVYLEAIKKIVDRIGFVTFDL